MDDNAHNGSAHGGILAYSKYKIQIANDNIYLDLRDSRYNADAGLDRGLDWYLYYYGYGVWKYGRGPGFPEHPIDEELGIWEVYAELGYPPSQNEFKVPVTVKTNFTNGNIIVNGNSYTSPYYNTTDYTQGSSLTIAVNSPQTGSNGHTYHFFNWSDGGAQTHAVTIPNLDYARTYTANFSDLSVSIAGPSYLLPNQIGTFTASIMYGVPPYTIKWYKMQLCSGTQELAGGEPDAPPCNVWIQQSRFDGKTTATACGSMPGFKMKVEVTDATSFKMSAEKQVIVQGETRKALPESAVNVELPETFALFPAYPNPFNPQTTLRYALPEASQVMLSIYNLHGAALKTLLQAPQSAGVHSVSWDGTDQQGKIVPAGIYLCQLQAMGTTQKFSQTQKLSLIK